MKNLDQDQDQDFFDLKNIIERLNVAEIDYDKLNDCKKSKRKSLMANEISNSVDDLKNIESQKIVIGVYAGNSNVIFFIYKLKIFFDLGTK